MSFAVNPVKPHALRTTATTSSPMVGRRASEAGTPRKKQVSGQLSQQIHNNATDASQRFASSTSPILIRHKPVHHKKESSDPNLTTLMQSKVN